MAKQNVKYIRSEEWKKKQRESHEGNKCYFYGKHHTEKTKLKISEALKGIIFSEEHIKNMSESQKGHIPWNKDKKDVYSEKTIQRMSESQKGNKNCLGRFASSETKKKISESHKGKCGEISSNWQGGITPLQSLIRNCFKYRQWLSDIYTRDNFACQNCDIRGGNLNAHHINSFSSILQFYEITTLEESLECEELWNINNGITLCRECHKKLHKRSVK